MSLVLIVDDARPLAEQYAYDLKRLAGHEAILAGDGREALDVLAREPVDCVLLDLEMPGMDGFEVLRERARRAIAVPVIVYTATGDYDRCAQAIRSGAASFIDKAEPMERVVQEIAQALERRRLESEVAALQKEIGPDAMVGASPAIVKLADAIARVAPIPSPVLIVGESGSGKELVARAVHRQSGQAGAFVALNSAALPHELVESELFGHERGAFTGAATLRKGAFETAAGGTLFLDEIGELPLAAQAKLLRVLEARQLTRLGGNRTIAVDARVVAATNRDLAAEVKAGRFREDLLYRVNVHVLAVPPLRDRLSDLPELVQHLVAATCARFRMKPKTVSAPAIEALMAYDWRRNNVRELRNVLERMLIAAAGDRIGVEDVPAEIRDEAAVQRVSGGAPPRTFHERKAEAERQIIVAALERHEWHITRTAEALGLADHASLLKIMRRHGISRE
ncbi:MAG TPA: sigma-54 dependent transcriptional regulator [Gemmatimonadales bacterium]|nr:sigma-54 dependent transcriptional regulator [Gemmatimonadales bacterium]